MQENKYRNRQKVNAPMRTAGWKPRLPASVTQHTLFLPFSQRPAVTSFPALLLLPACFLVHAVNACEHSVPRGSAASGREKAKVAGHKGAKDHQEEAKRFLGPLGSWFIGEIQFPALVFLGSLL